MSHGRNYAYSETMDTCTLCGTHLKAISALGIYLVSGHGAIHYPMCIKCTKLAQKGLPPIVLRILDEKLEARAIELGLAEHR